MLRPLMETAVFVEDEIWQAMLQGLGTAGCAAALDVPI